MKFKNIFVVLILIPITAVVLFIVLTLLYTRGPIPILRLTPYQETQKRVTFPQWINDDEICYLELVLHRDWTVFEQGKFFLFIKMPIMDIYIYRQKVGQPETKKLIRHIARKGVEPSQSLEGSLDRHLGLRVYDNGKKIFLYYCYYYNSDVSNDYRYVTLDITGKNMKERTPKKILPRDISQDGEKIYGLAVGDVSEYCIAEYILKEKKVKKLINIAEGKFERSKRGRIKDLKLLSRNALILSYHTDVNMPNGADFIYLINISDGTSGLIDELLLEYHRTKPYYSNSGEYVIDAHHGYAISKDERYLILGNVGIYERREDGWAKIKDFYKEYPSASPNGKKLVFCEFLVKKGKLNRLLFSGRKFKITSFKNLLENEEPDSRK